MTYIQKNDRVLYDQLITSLSKAVKVGGGTDNLAGQLNYVITKLLKSVYGEKINYKSHNEIIGMLDCCKMEWYRRQTSPYEDEKIKTNGDV